MRYAKHKKEADVTQLPAGTTRKWFSSQLTALREERQMTLRELAKESGVPVSSLSLYFSGRRLPSDDDVVSKIARALDTDPVELHSKWVYAREQDEVERATKGVVTGPRGIGPTDMLASSALVQALDEDAYAVLWLKSMVLAKTPESVTIVSLPTFDIGRLEASAFSSTEELARAIIKLASESP